MNQYQIIKDLEEKLIAGESLDDLEYLRIINYRRNIMKEDLDNINNSNYFITFAKLKVLTLLGKLGGKKTKFLPDIATYYGSTLNNLKDNYNEVLNGADIVTFNRTKTNMVTFLGQVKELQNYDNLLDKFEGEFTKKLNKGLKTFRAPVCLEEMIALDESQEKIKTLSLQYRR